MTVQKQDYPSDSSLQRLRKEVTQGTEKPDGKTSVPGEGDGSAQESVDKSKAGKPA